MGNKILIMLIVSIIFVEVLGKIKIDGYGQIQYEVKEGYDDLRVRRFRLKFDGKLDEEKIFYCGTIDLERAPTVRVRDAYLGYNFGGPLSLKLTVGQHSVPFSADHLISSRIRKIAERSKVTSNLAPGRDLGAPADIGITLAGKYSYFDFIVGIFQGGAIIQDKKFSSSVTEEIDNHKDVVLRLICKGLVTGLNLGISFYNGKLGNLVRQRAGIEILYNGKDVSLQTEYMFGEDPLGKERAALGRAIKKSGYYIQLAYKLTPIDPKLEPVIRYGLWDPNIDTTDNEETQLTLALNYYLSKHIRLLLDYTRNIENPTDLDNDELILRYQIKF